MPLEPDITVAAIIAQHERFLLVRERVNGRIVHNQPAGHLEPGERLVDAVVRETREETGRSFRPEALVGVYLWHKSSDGRAVLRFNFHGTLADDGCEQPLDPEILGTTWLSAEDLLSPDVDLRSPMVARAVDDYGRGARFPLEIVTEMDDTGITQPKGEAR